ncbi:LysR family transcriptional regulator [Psychromonas marina]|uniref:LysR family transcriptional regulator n=1 Tax=Psychromonas marina TaxID=88364 RepID=A0ABQ6E0Q2_9GAMM|nr:LysR family transcriptional regulator [Psychromonas marina]GLS90785.1 LysR family transcriptional regulator [Psychromonas marina]
MHFSLEQLQAFVAVYEQLSFSKAALTLNKHRTTIGQVITNLEDQLAVTLFERLGRSVAPTEEGNLLFHYAKQALEQARVFDNVALSLSYGVLESITFAYPSMVPHQILAAIRIQLAKDFPMMRVNFVERGKAEIKEGLQNGDFHFGLVNIHDSTAIQSLSTSLIGHIEFIPFVQKDSEIAKLPSDKRLIAFRTTRQFVLKSLVDEGMKDKVLVSAKHEEIDELAVIIKFVQKGLGWALLPKLLSESEYSTNNIESVYCDEMKEGFKFPISLWSQHSKQTLTIRKSIIVAVDEYVKDIKQQLSEVT